MEKLEKKQLIKKYAIMLTIMFVISLLFSVFLGLIGNVVISLICGIVGSSGKKTASKKILPLFSFLAVLEAATFLCLTVFPLGAGSFDSTLIIMGLSFSTFLFIVGWLIGEIWPWWDQSFSTINKAALNDSLFYFNWTVNYATGEKLLRRLTVSFKHLIV